MSKAVLVSKENRIGTISLNRPDKYNAFNREMSIDLKNAVDEIKDDDDIRAVLIEGNGKAFMVGGDIHYFHENLQTLSNDAKEIMDNLHAFITGLQNLQKPVLCKVHGSVAGVGMSIMLASDLVIASQECKFTTAYLKLGISPDGGLSYFLPRAVGKKKAAELFLLSELIDAASAESLGLINWVVHREDLDDEATKILQKITAGPSFAYGQLKQLLRSSDHNDLETQLEQEAKSFCACSATEDFKSGVEAFLNKSPAVFS